MPRRRGRSRSSSSRNSSSPSQSSSSRSTSRSTSSSSSSGSSSKSISKSSASKSSSFSRGNGSSSPSSTSKSLSPKRDRSVRKKPIVRAKPKRSDSPFDAHDSQRRTEKQGHKSDPAKHSRPERTVRFSRHRENLGDGETGGRRTDIGKPRDRHGNRRAGSPEHNHSNRDRIHRAGGGYDKYSSRKEGSNIRHARNGRNERKEEYRQRVVPHRNRSKSRSRSRSSLRSRSRSKDRRVPHGERSERVDRKSRSPKRRGEPEKRNWRSERGKVDGGTDKGIGRELEVTRDVETNRRGARNGRDDGVHGRSSLKRRRGRDDSPVHNEGKRRNRNVRWGGEDRQPDTENGSRSPSRHNVERGGRRKGSRWEAGQHREEPGPEKQPTELGAENSKWGGSKRGSDQNRSGREGKEGKGDEGPNFGLSGKLAEESNKVKGVVLKFTEPPEARRPTIKWRLYVFKGGDCIGEPIPIHRQACYLFGRDRAIVDIPTDHPSCSKQHSVLQFRLVEVENADGSVTEMVKPYLMDLESVNGSFINRERIEAHRYYELLEQDTVRFGLSSREYVVLHENSA